MEELILIDGGDMFEGNWDQLADCFGIMDSGDLVSFCLTNDCEYEIKTPTLH